MASELYRATNESTGVAGVVCARDDGQFAVTLLDLDCGERLDTIHILRLFENACTYARFLAGLETGTVH